MEVELEEVLPPPLLEGAGVGAAGAAVGVGAAVGTGSGRMTVRMARSCTYWALMAGGGGAGERRVSAGGQQSAWGIAGSFGKGVHGGTWEEELGCKFHLCVQEFKAASGLQTPTTSAQQALELAALR